MNRRTLRILLVLLLSMLLASCLGGGSGGSNKVSVSENGLEEDEPSQAPRAKAGQDQYVIGGSTLTLDGSSSSDPDDDPLTFLWAQSGGPHMALADKHNPTTSIVAPTVSQATVYSFDLEVSDSRSTGTDTVNVILLPLSDGTAPQVASRDPRQNAGGVVSTAVVTVLFSEPLLAKTVNAQSFTLRQNGQPVSGTIDYDVPGLTATFTPDIQLAPKTSYTVALSNSITDTADNPLAASTWSFTTGSFLNLGPTPQSTINACMSDADKDMLSRVNNARAQARTCGSTDYPATAPLAWHCDLEQAAQTHSSDMANNDFFSHTGSNGSNAGQRISATGYQSRIWGENVAAGYTTAAATLTEWLASSGHCSNIMRSNYRELGAASATKSGTAYGIYWTQVFADR